MEKATYAFSERERGKSRGDKGDMAAYRLLSKRGYDAEGLLRDMHSFQLQTQLDHSVENLESFDIEGYLQHHQELIVLTAISGARRSAEENVQKLQKNWIDSSWAKARKNFTNSLGQLPQDIPESNPLLLTNDTPGTVTGMDLVAAGTGMGIGISTNGGIITTDKKIGKTHRNFTLSRHAAVVENINGSVTSGARYLPSVELLKAFEHESAKQDMEILGLSLGDLKQYKSCLKLMRDMVGENKEYIEDPDILANTRKANTRRHYEMCFYDSKICRGSTIGAEVVGGARLARTKQFVKKSLPIAQPGPCTADHYPLWPVVYYSIRSGDMENAIKLLREYLADNRDSSDLPRRLDSLITLLHVFDDRSERIKPDDVREMIKICRDWKNDVQGDPHHHQILNLLCCEDVSEMELPDLDYIECLLWTNLWLDTWSQTLLTLGVDERYGSFFEISDYLIEDRPFINAIMHLATQNYKGAIISLHEKGKHVAATHLLVLCLYYKLILPTDPLCGSTERDIIMPSHLLMIWIRMISKSTDLGVCAEYILTLRTSLSPEGADTWRPCLLELIKDSSMDKLKVLIGDLDPTGMRDVGKLDNHLEFSEVNKIIEGAANDAQEIGDFMKPFLLFRLSGRDDLALRFAFQKLQQYMFLTHPKDLETRREISKHCRKFYEQKRRKGDAELQILHILLEIVSFVDQMSSRNFTEARKTMKGLNIFPSPTDHIQDFSKRWQEHYHFCLRGIVDETLVKYMGCLAQVDEYNRRSTDEGYYSRQGIQEEAKVLLEFSRMLDSSRCLRNGGKTINELTLIGKKQGWS